MMGEMRNFDTIYVNANRNVREIFYQMFSTKHISTLLGFAQHTYVTATGLDGFCLLLNETN